MHGRDFTNNILKNITHNWLPLERFHCNTQNSIFVTDDLFPQYLDTFQWCKYIFLSSTRVNTFKVDERMIFQIHIKSVKSATRKYAYCKMYKKISYTYKYTYSIVVHLYLFILPPWGCITPFFFFFTRFNICMYTWCVAG